MTQPYDAIVLGAGEAGAVLATRAVAHGYRVAMVYQEPYGSVCLNAGCVASKFLIHRAKIAHTVRSAAKYHVTTSPPRVDLAAIVAEKNALIERNRAGAFEAAATAELLTLVQGPARFLSPTTVAVGERILEADRIFIATGLRPAIPDVPGLAEAEPFTSDNVMDLAEVPGHLLCIGGSYVACELGQAFARFGARVTIVEQLAHLVPQEEPDVSTLLERAFDDEGIEVLLETEVVAVTRETGGVRVTVRASDGSEQTIEVSHLLVAAGRTPNTDGLNLARAGVAVDESGFVQVNDRLETTAPGIWAIGDVNGQQPFTRVCQEEAKIAFANAFAGASLSVNRAPLGHAIFTDPEIAAVGLTERQARAEGHDVIAGLVTFDEVEKAQLIGETTGFIKYVAERESRRILGCHVIGPDAADLIYPAIVVMRGSGTLDDLALAVGIFPTLQEGMEGTARAVLRRVAPEIAGGPLAATGLRGARPEREHGSRTSKTDFDREEAMAGQSNFSCPSCGAEFNSREKLNDHKSREHAQGGRSGAGKTGTPERSPASRGTEGPRTPKSR